jgi:hypothetical protein
VTVKEVRGVRWCGEAVSGRWAGEDRMEEDDVGSHEEELEARGGGHEVGVDEDDTTSVTELAEEEDVGVTYSP